MKTEFMPVPTNWQKLPFHPLSELIGFGVGIDLDGLESHIREHGYDEQEPIVVYRDGRTEYILDGRHKHTVCVKLGITPTFRRFVGKSAEAYVAKKAFRQHLSASQRAMIAASIATATRGGDRSKGSIDPLKTSDDAAKILNVGEKSVDRAKQVITHGTPALQEAVKDGTVSVSDAAKVASEPAKVQDAAVAKVKSGKAATATQAAKPKSGKPIFDDKVVIDTIGKLAKLLDLRTKVYGKCREHSECLELLDKVLIKFKQWKNK